MLRGSCPGLGWADVVSRWALYSCAARPSLEKGGHCGGQKATLLPKLTVVPLSLQII